MTQQNKKGKTKDVSQKPQDSIYGPNARESTQRDAYAHKLIEIGGQYENVVIMDADLSLVSKTYGFKEHFPERHMQIGIGEQNMIGIAAGVAETGMIPVVHSLAAFVVGRAFDQIRLSICYSNLNVKIVGLHAGVSLAPDGATHQAMEDIAMMCSLPGMQVISSADAQQTRDLLPQIIESPAPAYLRLYFPKIPKTIEPGTSTLGKIQVLREGTDISLVATGQLVYKTLLAANELSRQGISAEVLNVHTIKPLDRDTLISSLRKTGKGVVIEEHNIYGGLGSIVSTVMAENHPVKMGFVNTNDRFGSTGLPEQVLTEYGLQSTDIVEKALTLISR
ncbi:MAG: transketolase family protein [Deltaproteobacteria bacterium]|nr:transketolase family protein [Deltaproteobacteria bacterium]